MKVIHYIPSIDRTWGGTSTYMQVLAKPLGALVELHILTHASDNPLPMGNNKVHFIPHYRPFSHKWKSEVSTLFENIAPDVVHINCCWTPDCAAVQRLAQSRGYKVVLTPHGMLEPWIVHRHYWTRKLPALWLYQKAAIKNADCIQATAESEKANILTLGYNSRIRVVKLGIDADGIEMKNSWKKTRQLLFLSRVHVKKGINYLIEAVAVLRNLLQGYRIVVAGDGDADYVVKLKEQINAEGLNGIVKLVGGVYGKQKWNLFQKSDFFVLPTNSENFGLAIAEALASGTPVITTKGTPWSDLNEWQAGEWIEIGTQPLVESLRRLVTLSEEEMEKMGRNGRRLIETKYSAKVTAEKMMDVYGSLIE